MERVRMDQFTDSFIFNRTCCCFNTKHAIKMLLSIVRGRCITLVLMLENSLLFLISNISNSKL